MVKVVLLIHVDRGENMKAINLKNNKEVEFWIVNHEISQPDWVKRLFYIGLLGWIDADSLRYGLIGIRSYNGARLSIGDVLVYDNKHRVEITDLDYMTYENFAKKYEVISE